jgi:small subunit ribosomal protein S2
MAVVSMKQLLEAGVHFGHQTRRWNPKMKSYIFGARNGIYIIDLQKTDRLFNTAYQFVLDTAAAGESVLFVGTKQQARETLREEAERCGMFYVDHRWLGGMLTNFKTIKTRIDRLDELTTLLASEKAAALPKKEAIQLRKEQQKLEKSLAGIRKMQRVPGLLIVIDPNREHLAVEEAKKLGIPIVSITDTNCDPDGIDYMVPANDDALKSIRLFVNQAAEACLAGVKEFEARIQAETRQRIERERRPAAKAEDAAAARPVAAAPESAAPTGTPNA